MGAITAGYRRAGDCPVSYTHLDVYKRQSEGSAGVSGVHSAAAGSWIKNPFGA